tara:strand:- start:722 stop:1018 length:297 start_codon:yes stop_codon:yes gene_type:complete
MVKQSKPDEIVLDDIMQESMKEMGKGETSEVVKEDLKPVETPQNEKTTPQFGFKLGHIDTPDTFIVQPKEKEPKKDGKEQVILERPSQGLDDDIVVDW